MQQRGERFFHGLIVLPVRVLLLMLVFGHYRRGLRASPGDYRRLVDGSRAGGTCGPAQDRWDPAGAVRKLGL